MKRIAILLAMVVSLSLSAQAQAQSNTDGLSVGFGYDRYAYGVSARLGDIIGLVGFSTWGINVAADYRLLKGDLSSANNLSWYIGPGAGVFVGDFFVVGLRGTGGLLWKFADRFELNGQVSPTFFIGDESGFNFSYSAGIRYRF